jgi:predicted metal-binding membrane protein
MADGPIEALSGALQQRIARDIQNQIEAGVLRDGEVMPSTRVLAEQAGASVWSVNEAMKALAEIGLVENQSRSRRIVRSAHLAPKSVKVPPRALLIGGYLSIWVLFGVLVHAADLGVQQVVHASTTLTSNPWLIAASIFAVAGLYQFSALKYRCLDKCRSPLSFVTSYWKGRDEWRNSFALGVHHGIFCVGCCWSLMLLMFVVGHGNIGWMFLLGVVMGAEKNLRWGKSLAKPLGIGLIIGAGLIVFAGLYFK